MSQEIWRGIKVGMTIIGTTIGAGFASGREIWEFFSSYGPNSMYSLLLSMILFGVAVMVILWAGSLGKTRNYSQFLEQLMGSTLAKAFDVLIFLYLLSVSVIMFAGSGATFSQWNFSFIIGVFIMAAIVYIVLLFDARGLMSIHAAIIPFLVGMLYFVTIYFLTRTGTGGMHEMRVIAGAVEQPSWPAGITYTALNIVPLIAVLTALGGEIKSMREMWTAGLIGVGALGTTAFLLNYSLNIVGKEVLSYEIPLFSLLQFHSAGMSIAVSIVLWLAIFTTAVSSIYGIASRLSGFTGWSIHAAGLLLILLIIPLTRIGFANLVAFLYPLYGVINLFVLAMILLFPLTGGPTNR